MTYKILKCVLKIKQSVSFKLRYIVITNLYVIIFISFLVQLKIKKSSMFYLQFLINKMNIDQCYFLAEHLHFYLCESELLLLLFYKRLVSNVYLVNLLAVTNLKYKVYFTFIQMRS